MDEWTVNFAVSMVGNPDRPVYTREVDCGCKTRPGKLCEHWSLAGYLEDADFPTVDQIASGFAFSLNKFRDNPEED